MATREIHICADIEADGRIPGPFSMVSLGLCVAGVADGGVFQALDAAERTFYRELRPISDRFDPEALAVSGLSREHLITNGADPAQAMSDAAAFIAEVSDGARPVFVAWPLGYDWKWVDWYFWAFHGANPFGHSEAIDMKSVYIDRAGCSVDEASLRRLPAELRSERPHTHNAVDDAIEQAEIWQKLVRWPGRR